MTSKNLESPNVTKTAKRQLKCSFEIELLNIFLPNPIQVFCSFPGICPYIPMIRHLLFFKIQQTVTFFHFP